MNLKLLTAVALCATLATVGCSKKKAAPAVEKAATAAKAGATKGKVALAQAAKLSAKKVASNAGNSALKPAAMVPTPKDVALAEDAGVVAWLTIKSIGAAFDAGETIATKMGAVPPGASLREAAYRDLTKLLSSQGITGHEWLDKTKAVHFAMQDDDKANPQGGLVLLLPVTAKKKAMSAFATAKTGAEAKGHAAILVAVGKTLYIDFIDGYVVLSSVDSRFKKIETFAKRLSKLSSPSLVYLGLSMTEISKTREDDISALLAQLEQMSRGVTGGGAPQAGNYYNKMLKEWLHDLKRLEVLVNASGENVEIGWRLHAKPGTRIARQMLAGKGRNAKALADTLPGNSYFAFVANMDPTAATGQLEDTAKLLKEAFKLDDATMATLKADIRSTTKLQTGESFAAAYPDGDAPLGFVLGAGARDPTAMVKVMRKLVSVIMLRLIVMEEEKAKRRDPKAPLDPKMAIVKRALTEMRVTPLIEAFGPIAKESGLIVTSNTSKDGGVTCDVIDLTMDWAKLAKVGGGKDAMRAAKILGPRTALALCAGGNRVVVSGGPSALEQGRRAAAAKPGGLGASPVFKGSLQRSVANPAWFVYLNAGASLKAFEKALPAPVAMPADRAISMGCGNRQHSFGCELDVPVEIIKAAIALTKRAP